MSPAGEPVLETELLCDESLSEIIKEDEEEAVSSDSLNGRKRLRTDEEQEEYGNATEAVSDSNKLRRIHEEEGQNELDGQNRNQDSERGGNQESEVADVKDGGNQENNNGEEDKKEEDENEETKEEKEDETEELTQCSTTEEEGEKHKLEEHRENTGGNNNVNRLYTEQNEHGEEESKQNEGKEYGENGEKEEKEKETEEEKQKAAAKGKRPSLEAITPNFSKPKQGEPSYTPEGDQTQNSSPKDDTEFIDHELNNNNKYDYHRDLAILRSMWHFKCNNGELPYPHSNELHNHIMDSIPNLNILGDDLTEKITAFEDDFNTVRILDGDNPEMAHPVEREIFDFSMRLWGDSEDNVGDGI